MLGYKKLAQLNPIVTFLGFLDTHLLIPVIALYATSLGADIATVGLVIGVYSITNIVTNIIGGRWVDKFGYKAPLIIGLCGDTIAMIAYTLCQVPWHLALVRAFHGFSGGLVGPATMAFAAKYASPAKKGGVMSSYGIALAASTLIGYGAGGTVASRFDYHILFYAGSVLLLIGVLLATLMPFEKATTQQEKMARCNAKDILMLAKRGKLPISYLSIFAQYFSFGGVVALLPLYMAILNMEVFHFGMALAIFSFMFIIVQFISGTASDRAGRLKPTVIALGLSIVSLISLSQSENFPATAIVMAIYGIAYGILFPAVSAQLIDYTAPEEYGIATGIFHALITIGVAVGSPIMGWIAQYTGLQAGLALLPIIYLPALILTIANMKKERDHIIVS